MKMSSKKGGGSGEKPKSAASDESSSKGKNAPQVPEPNVDQLTRGMANASVESDKDDGWEVTRKHKNKSRSNVGKPWGTLNPNAEAWGNADVMQKLGFRDGSGKAPANAWAARTTESIRPAGRGTVQFQSSNRGFENSAQTSVMNPPLEQGWDWQGRSSLNKSVEQGPPSQMQNHVKAEHLEDDDDPADDLDDFDDDLESDEYDSDESQKSHETRKQSKWFKPFFDILDSLTVDQINEPARQWHCSTCQGGPGAIDWYHGLQPLITHAKTKGSTRVKLHRELAELLDEELHRRGTSAIPAGEAYGKWKGLSETVVKDKEIVWPPMVIIMNTQLEKDDNDKWLGMGNSELLDYFNSYPAVRARHSYGPQGHRGMSVLIFEASAVGYSEAERLTKNFEDQGTDREGWERRRVTFYPGGQRQLYGYMAEKLDMDIFNKHSQGKSKLKFEMRSYHEMVVSQMKQMSEDNQQLLYFKNKVAKEQKHSKALEESFGILSEKLRRTLEENRIVRQRTKTYHEQNKEEMDYQEEFFKEQIKLIHDVREEKEENFEKLQQLEREKVKQFLETPSSTEDHQHRVQKVEKFIKCQMKEMDEFIEARDKLLKDREDKKAEMKLRHRQEEVNLEQDFDAELTRLMEKYTPNQPSEGKYCSHLR